MHGPFAWAYDIGAGKSGAEEVVWSGASCGAHDDVVQWDRLAPGPGDRAEVCARLPAL
jgi:hypothetical protein